MRTLKAGTLAKNNRASCLVPALALKLCTESQPGKCSRCQTAPEKQFFSTWMSSLGWLPAAPRPALPAQGREQREGRGKWPWQGWPAAPLWCLWMPLAWVGVRQDIAQGMWRDRIPPTPPQCPGEPHITPLCQRHLRGSKVWPNGWQSHPMRCPWAHRQDRLKVSYLT